MKINELDSYQATRIAVLEAQKQRQIEEAWRLRNQPRKPTARGVGIEQRREVRAK